MVSTAFGYDKIVYITEKNFTASDAVQFLRAGNNPAVRLNSTVHA